MEDVREFLFNKIEDRDDLDDKTVADFLGVSTRQLYYLKSGQRYLTFRNILRLVLLVDSKNYRIRMKDWCLRLQTDDCIKNAFEYAAVIRDVELLKSLLDEHKSEKGVIGQYVRVYSFIYKYMTGQTKFNKMEQALLDLKSINDSSLKILIDIYKCIALLHKRQFSYLIDKATFVEREIKNLSDKTRLFLKECFLFRLSEVLSITNLFLNNLEEARRYASIILEANINKRAESDAYYVLGMSYLMNNPQECVHYLEKSCEKALETNSELILTVAKYNLNMAKLLLSQELGEDAHESIVAVRDYREGNISYEAAEEKAKMVGDLDLLDYLGSMKEKKVENLHKKFHDFVANSNLYFAVIIVRDLMEAGENSDFIKSLANLRKNSSKGEVLFEKNFISCFSVRNSCSGRVSA
ncbi:AimR family lysis-lysogeny pheromone receptor [Bacillus subtilis]|uniref:AimR family lysis-lysogeny pheromone receptor n=1 Tax=Bacillus subtilis TaxID=1423 RepID=UPI003F833196